MTKTAIKGETHSAIGCRNLHTRSKEHAGTGQLVAVSVDGSHITHVEESTMCVKADNMSW